MTTSEPNLFVISNDIRSRIGLGSGDTSALEAEIEDLEDAIAVLEGANAALEGEVASLEPRAWRKIGELDFRTMTPTVISAGGTVVDGVTFANTSLGGNPALSASIALTISALGIRATGADAFANRSVDINLADFCDEVLDTKHSYAIVTEVSGLAPHVIGIGPDTDNMIMSVVDATNVLGWQRASGLWQAVQQVAHGGNVRQIGLTVLPGGRIGIVSFTATANAGAAIRPAAFTSPTMVASHGVVGVTAQTAADLLFLATSPSAFYIQRFSVWTDKPA